MKKSTDQVEEFSDELNQIPKSNEPHIRIKEIRNITIPHPYCITQKHVSHASDHFSGMLGKDAIIDAEKHGAKCDICRTINKKHGNPILAFDQHITQKTLFIEVPQNSDLNKVKGLHEYLMKIKPVAESIHIDGFAFPTYPVEQQR